MGSIQKKDVLILISYSGQTNELKNIIQYANRNKILLIGIMSKKESILYSADKVLKSRFSFIYEKFDQAIINLKLN